MAVNSGLKTLLAGIMKDVAALQPLEQVGAMSAIAEAAVAGFLVCSRCLYHAEYTLQIADASTGSDGSCALLPVQVLQQPGCMAICTLCRLIIATILKWRQTGCCTML